MGKDLQKQLMEKDGGGDDLTFYRFIIDSLPVGVLTVDSERTITSFNPWAERITGYTFAEVQGKFCGDVLHGGKCLTYCPLKTVLTLKNPILRVEGTIQNRYGEIIPVRMNTAALMDDNGRLIGGVEAFQDISYLKTLEREKDNFISMLAHDMRSSLSIIGGFVLRLLRKDTKTDDEKKEKYLEVVKAEEKKLESLIDDFLEFSRLQTGRLKLNPTTISIDKLLMELYEVYEPKATEMGIKLHLQNESDLPLIEADSRQLQRAFTNLLENAMKFSSRKGTITLAAHRGEGAILVEVKDEGMGIPHDELPYIFDAFHRGEVGQEIKGYGLGLASVKTIIEAHGGRVLVESERGKGSTFRVVLPEQNTIEKAM